MLDVRAQRRSEERTVIFLAYVYVLNFICLYAFITLVLMIIAHDHGDKVL